MSSGNRPFRTGWSRRTRASRYSGCTRRSGSSLRSNCPGGPGYTWKPLWPCGACGTLNPCGACGTLNPCGTCGTCGTRCPSYTWKALWTCGARIPNGSYWARDACCSCSSGDTRKALRSSWSRKTAFSLNPLRACWPLKSLRSRNSRHSGWSGRPGHTRNPL